MAYFSIRLLSCGDYMDMKRYQYLSILVLCFGTTVAAMGQASSTARQDSTYERNILYLPAIGSTPETGFLIGGVVIPQFKVGGANIDTRSSSILFSAIYTFKRQILIGVFPDLYFPDEQWILTGNYFANYFPQNFWGAGPHTTDDDKLNALFTKVNFDQTVLRKVGPDLFAGPFLKWSRLANLRFEDMDENPVPPPTLPGAKGSTSAGFGVTGRIDKRESSMTPTGHHFAELSIQTYPAFLGSTDPFTSYKLDVRKYFDVAGDGSSVLALQTVLRSTMGEPPFEEMSRIGGDIIGRGYYDGRYRDANAAQLQAEWRQNVYGIFGVTVFGGLGQVWDRLDEFDRGSIKPSGGVGLRFNLNKSDPTNLRIDFGVGRESTGFYIQFGEAF